MFILHINVQHGINHKTKDLAVAYSSFLVKHEPLKIDGKIKWEKSDIFDLVENGLHVPNNNLDKSWLDASIMGIMCAITESIEVIKNENITSSEIDGIWIHSSEKTLVSVINNHIKRLFRMSYALNFKKLIFEIGTEKFINQICDTQGLLQQRLKSRDSIKKLLIILINEFETTRTRQRQKKIDIKAYLGPKNKLLSSTAVKISDQL